MNPRTILKYFLAMEQAEGAGARVRRSIGTWDMRNFTPFLMLDHFNTSAPNGFPTHPHRGQETISYILGGAMAHADFTGSSGVLYSGDLQFMTAGKGVVHSEIPVEMEDKSPCVGMQLWVDLPEKLKFCEPRYRDLKGSEIPVARPSDKVEVKVISGTSYGVESVQDLAYTPVVYYHYTVKPGGEFSQELPEDFNAFLYVMKGSLLVNGVKIPQYNNVFFNRDGDGVVGKVSSSAGEAAEFVLVGGKVLDQPIEQGGPFVATSKMGVQKAFMDYQFARNGFERAPGWSSKYDNGVKERDLPGYNARDEL